jgi:hypothetical protein
MDSNYQFQLLFHDQKNESIIYERDKVSYLDPKSGATFNYGLLPNLKHTIIFQHFVQSMGYAQSNMTILPSIQFFKDLRLNNLFFSSFNEFISICGNQSSYQRRI